MSEVLSPARRWASLAVLVGAVLLLAIDATVLYLAVPSLTAELSPTATQVLWIGDVYSLVLAGLLVTMGNLADRIGRKRLLLIGATAFGAASVLAAFAPSSEVLIVARLLLGVAGATIMPSTLSLIRNIFTEPIERTRAVAIWSAAAASGIALGPLVGGALLERFWWGSVFLINLPVMLLVLVVGGWLLPESRNPNPGRFDLISSGLSMLAIIPFVYTIKQLTSGSFGLGVVAAIVASVVGAVLFVHRQRRVAAPMIDVELFRNPAFSGAVLVNFISVFALSGVLFFFSQYLQLARGLGPLEAGVAQLPAALSAMAAVAAVGFLLTRLGRGRAIATALLIGAAGLGLLAALEGSEELIWVLLPMIPLGLGIGIAETLSVDAVVSSVRPTKAGAAASVAETAYELGVALGIAVLGSVITVLYRGNLDLPTEVAGEVAARAEDSLASATAILEPGSSALTAAQEAFMSAMQTTTLVAGAVMVVAAIVAFTLIPNDKAAVSTEH
ncbi:MFS transporter [Actinoalloteichus hymeniacidonis]|uniref:Major Facilitator Superfamily transporter n=1 Tax=Actinoalloteichus hymeniacidonis TaxID=340345 RepID=A0AAC9HMS5_9PSEU|nr:MFS transporter [Actinoalloteichus hymeniacidonis]AOS62028.1 Major Facilitator Superfamily transporter [Actinoalloteichus hymeniacidonis]MBB5909950.1 DHA2 family multidrug resistance protein-like MFS transporter [Actinoalloteichus hymeniacidonis]